MAITGLTVLALTLSLTAPSHHRPESPRWLLVGVAVIAFSGGVLEVVIGAVDRWRSE
jgi:ABC-type Fe3+-siderophore transport system permease subunit